MGREQGWLFRSSWKFWSYFLQIGRPAEALGSWREQIHVSWRGYIDDQGHCLGSEKGVSEGEIVLLTQR